jgi:hypothetical protein
MPGPVQLDHYMSVKLEEMNAGIMAALESRFAAYVAEILCSGNSCVEGGARCGIRDVI